MNYSFIVNPVAGKDKGERTIPFIKKALGQKNIPYKIYRTTREGEAKEIAEKIAKEEVDTIVAVGGDGTINEVLNGMAKSEKVLGIIPAGTGNDLSRTLKLPQNTEEALEVLFKRRIQRIDLGEIQGKYFINFASIGLDAAIAQEANRIKKHFLGSKAYIFAALKKIATFKSAPVEIFIDDKRFSKKVMMITICNGIYYGGGMKVAPKADIEDGYFDVCIINEMSKLKLLFLFPTIYWGKHVNYEEVEFYRGKNIKILSRNRFEINADGEIVSNEGMEFKLLRKKINIITNPSTIK